MPTVHDLSEYYLDARRQEVLEDMRKIRQETQEYLAEIRRERAQRRREEDDESPE